MNKSFLSDAPVATRGRRSKLTWPLPGTNYLLKIPGSPAPKLKSIKVIWRACILLIWLAWFPFSLIAQKTTGASQTTISKNTSVKVDSARYNVISLSNGTFGYDIYLAGKKYIHQQTIPGLPGNKGFSSKKDAAKVAALVVQKIAKGNLPPTVSSAELKRLKIL